MSSPIARFAGLTAIVLFTSVPAMARLRAVSPPVVQISEFAEGGYADRTSVVQGGQIALHISTAITPFTATIVNLQNQAVTLRTLPGLTSTSRDCTGHFADGCGWPVTTTISIPASWPSGYYAASFPTTAGTRYVPFVVRAANPGAATGTLIVSSTNTFQAYNAFGGESAQVSDTTARSDQVSFDRPYDTAEGLGGYVDWEDDFALWMQQEGIGYEVATDSDLEDPTFLPHYTSVVFVGHSEYWTANARTNVATFSAHGGHIAILGGNTMWWQARTAANGRALVIYKDASRDPDTGTNNSLVTVNWFDDPVFNPENTLTGASFRNGGYVNRAGDPSTWSADPRTFTFKPMNQRIGFTVLAPTSWVFAGTKVQVGQTFGKAAAGLEVDGVVYNCDSQGLPAAPDGSDGTPLNYQILAYAPATNGFGTVGIYVNAGGGAVFNAASEEWPSSLATDPVTSLVTDNVLRRFETGQPFTYNPVTTAARTLDLFNCPQSAPDVLPWWTGDIGTAKLTSSCAYEGKSGLQLIGPGELSVARGFAPDGNGLSHVEVRFYINADSFNALTDDPIALVTIRNHRGDTVQRFAQVELYDVNGHKGVRVSTLAPDGISIESATQFVDLPSGWQSIQVGWHSPGTVTFQVGNGTESSINNPHSGETANELELYYPPLPASDSVCLDAIAAGTDKLSAIAGLR